MSKNTEGIPHEAPNKQKTDDYKNKGTSHSVMVSKLVEQIFTNEFKSHWAFRSYGLEAHLIKSFVNYNNKKKRNNSTPPQQKASLRTGYFFFVNKNVSLFTVGKGRGDSSFGISSWLMGWGGN